MFKKAKGKKLFLLFLISFFFINFGNFCFATGLEITYPVLPTGGTVTPGSSLPVYLKYIFDFGMGMGFLITVLSLMVAGVLYILSSANPGLKAIAMDRFYGTITGFIFLLLTYLIVITINPDFKTFQIRGNLNKPPAPSSASSPNGVYLYAGQGCSSLFLKTIDKSSGDLKTFKNRVRSAKIVHGEDAYVAILYDIINFQGKCQYLDPNASCVSTLWPPNETFATSISVYKYNYSPGGGSITFYRKPSYDKEGGWLEIKGGDTTGIFQKSLNELCFGGNSGSCAVASCTVPEKERDCVKWALDGNKCIERMCPNLTGENVNSIKINGNYVVTLLHWDPSITGDKFKWSTCQVFPTIEDINKEGPKKIKWDYIRNQDNLPNWVVILPVKAN